MKPIAGTVVELATKDDFDTFLKEAGSTLVVVDFYADWCGPCQMIAPQIKALAEEFSGKVYFAKVNVDKNEEVTKQEGITAMPTFKLYKNGQKVNELSGANEAKLKKLIEDNK